MEFRHKSVLLRETMEYLKINPDGIYVDGTLGGGGHAYEICRRLSPNGKLIGIDQDEDAVRAAADRLSEFQDRTEIVRSNYRQMPEVLSERGIGQVDGILLDLGVSSYQLDDPERGFTYRTEDAPLTALSYSPENPVTLPVRRSVQCESPEMCAWQDVRHSSVPWQESPF